MKGQCRYIFSMGELHRRDDSILFKNEKGNNYIPIKDTKEIYCFNEVSFNTKFLDLISKAGITVHYFNYYGQYSGTYFPKKYLLSGKLLIKQAFAYENQRCEIAKKVVYSIARNIREVLYHYYRHGKTNLKYTMDICKDAEKLLNKTNNIQQIMAIEGNIWANFYDSFKYFLPEDFIMNKRVKRPPDNPINALISFGNSILYSKCISQLYHTHLEQSISFLHEPSEGRFSLSLDISEAFKPVVVFKTIFNLINTKKLNIDDHFNSELNYCLLNENGKKIFIEALENTLNETVKHPTLKRNVSYLSLIKYDGYKLIKYIMENKDFNFYLEEKLC